MDNEPINSAENGAQQPVVVSGQPINQPFLSVDPTPLQPVKRPKRSRLLLFAGLFASAVVVLAVVGWFMQAAKASTAAETYKSAVAEQLDDLLGAEDAKARAEIIGQRVELDTITAGSLVSPSYRQAQEVRESYQTYRDTYKTVIEERYATLDLSPFLNELSEAFDMRVPLHFQIVDDASLALAKQTYDAMKEKSDKLQALSKRLYAYTYDKKYRADQRVLAVDLGSMGTSWQSLAELHQQNIDLYTALEDAIATNNSEKIMTLSDEAEQMSANLQAKASEVSSTYAGLGKEFNATLNTFVQAIADDGYIQQVEADAQKAREAAEELRSTL